MIMYEKYCQLEIDGRWIGLETCVDKYVYPLAANFKDFLRLILVCGSTTAVEQIIGWSKEKFEDFLHSSHRVLIRTRLKMQYFDMKCVCFQSAYVQYASFNILFHIEILDFINL